MFFEVLFVGSIVYLGFLLANSKEAGGGRYFMLTEIAENPISTTVLATINDTQESSTLQDNPSKKGNISGNNVNVGDVRKINYALVDRLNSNFYPNDPVKASYPTGIYTDTIGRRNKNFDPRNLNY